MATEFNGKIELDIRDSEPDWGPYAAPTAPAAAVIATVQIFTGSPHLGLYGVELGNQPAAADLVEGYSNARCRAGRRILADDDGLIHEK